MLSITGSVGNQNIASATDFTWDMLKSPSAVIFNAATKGNAGEMTFISVSVKNLNSANGAIAAIPHSFAPNDQSVDVSTEGAADDGPTMAYHTSGRPMSHRDLGPLWLVYPFDDKTDCQSEKIYLRAIW